MTKDLALLVGPEQKWLSTTGFLDKIDDEPQGGDGESGVRRRPMRPPTPHDRRLFLLLGDLLIDLGLHLRRHDIEVVFEFAQGSVAPSQTTDILMTRLSPSRTGFRQTAAG